MFNTSEDSTRLIGLGALTGSVTSEALYNSSTQFKTQVTTVIPALVLNVRQTSINILNIECVCSYYLIEHNLTFLFEEGLNT